MPEWGWILVAALVVVAVIAVVIALRATATRRRTEGLKGRFGSEYDRVVVDQAGDQRAAEAELAEREDRRKKLDIVPLSTEANQRYAGEWRAVQTAFIDNPSGAVGDAERLITEVMRERGYPVDDFDRQSSVISVDHPQVVEDYRAAHHIYLAQQDHPIGTEDQRQAFVHYRALFDKLLGTDDQHTSQEARA